MKIYHYSPSTGEYLGSSEAELNPLEEGKLLIPASATLEIPPARMGGDVAVFRDGAWTLLPDLRGQVVYSKATGGACLVSAIGDLPTWVTTLEPIEHGTWNGSVWEFDVTKALIAIRAKRDAILSATDWTQLSDSPLTEIKKQEWQVYRQALRDFPATCDPASPVWPTEPA